MTTSIHCPFRYLIRNYFAEGVGEVVEKSTCPVRASTTDRIWFAVDTDVYPGPPPLAGKGGIPLTVMAHIGPGAEPILVSMT